VCPPPGSRGHLGEAANSWGIKGFALNLGVSILYRKLALLELMQLPLLIFDYKVVGGVDCLMPKSKRDAITKQVL
jgi:hypothetical protein